MKKLCHYISKYMGILVLAAAVLALIFPSMLQQIRPTVINYLLGVVMFGMGLTLNLQDFKIVFSRPKDVMIGCLAQFTVMPLLAWGLARVFQLDEALALGVVLVGCCPGGTASNVITYLAKGDLALSVGMTGVSTLLAPFMTPFLTWALAGKSVNVDVVGMLLSILWVVILPIVVGLVVKWIWPKFTEQATDYLPAFSSVAIAFIVSIVIAANANKLMAGGLMIVMVVILHNLCGLSLGYLIGRLLGLSDPKRRAISIEVGMQNSGLASSLATIHFAAYPLDLACKYCYYLEKQKLYPSDTSKVISDELLETFIRQYIEAQTMPQVLFTWHGGETLMRPVSFYRRALELQRRYARGRQIDNCLQTNGTLLTDEWCEFFRENNFLVGVSIDGPQEFHDAYRRSRTGKPSWCEVMHGIHLLQKHGVEWNALAVVNDFNADYPLAFYRFFKEIGCRYIQFTPVVERLVERADGLTLAPGLQEGGQVTDFSVTAEKWGRFCCAIYDEWVRHDVGKVFVQLFDATLANWAGEPPGVCSLSGMCGHAAVMEFNGDVYSCARLKHDTLPRQCRECRFLFACHGECPKNRFIRDKYGEPGLNYLCAGYRRFFEHVSADMDFMKAELDAQRPPSNIMLY